MATSAGISRLVGKDAAVMLPPTAGNNNHSLGSLVDETYQFLLDKSYQRYLRSAGELAALPNSITASRRIGKGLLRRERTHQLVRKSGRGQTCPAISTQRPRLIGISKLLVCP